MEWLRGPAWIDDAAIVLDTASATSYQPLAEPHIGIELARVHTNDEVVAFVRRYGLLRTKPAKTRGAPLRESLDQFLRITHDVRALLELAIDLQRAGEGDKSAMAELRDAITVPDDDMVLTSDGHGGQVERRAGDFIPPEVRYVGADDRTILVATSRIVARYVNECLRREDAGLQFVDRAAMGEDAPPARWRLGMMPNTLAGACYLSVALTLVDREPIGICAEQSCRKIFFIEDGRQRFCTATCANRARFKRYKERHGGPAKAPKEGK